MADSGWLRRKAPQRGARTPDEAADDDERDERQDDADDEPLVARRRTRRNRVSEAPSDASSSDEAADPGVGALERLLREDDSGEDDASDDNGDDDQRAFQRELGLEEDDGWDGPPVHHRGILNLQPLHAHFHRGFEIALHLANANAAEEAEVVDLQDAQNDNGQEIDLTALSSDSEDDVVVRGVGGGEPDDDDEVEIVGSNAAPMPIQPGGGMVMVAAPPRGGLSRKRRRPNDAGEDAAAASRFDTQRAESTNVSLENNETIERFKAALKCSVCLEVIEDMTSTVCGHVYCAKCIRLAIRVTHKCPLCQRPLRPTDIHGLYF